MHGSVLADDALVENLVEAHVRTQETRLPAGQQSEHYPAVSDATQRESLDRLQAEIAKVLRGLGSQNFPSPECTAMAQSLPLSHAMPSSTFVDVAADKKGIGWKLLSPARLDELGIKDLHADSAEAVLQTAEFVFLFCGQFRYPETQAGFLFATTLETERSADCEASPFDSGALQRKVSWPDASESAISFLNRHTLPVPEYRQHLANRLQYLFEKPQHYAEKNETFRPDPIGLVHKPPATKRDPRLWTFEIRARNEVPLSAPHLAVVFYPRRLRGQPSVRNFLATLANEVAVEQVVMEDDGDFAALQRGCLDFLRSSGIIPASNV